MALLEYATRTVPDVVKKSVVAFFNQDPLMKRLMSRNRVKRSGGTHVRVVRVKSGHSDLVQIDSTNMSVPLNKKETLSSMTGDWGKYIKPIILPHFDTDRMSDRNEKKRYVQDMTDAAMQSLRNDICQQVYIGDQTNLTAVGTLNGEVTTLTSSGFTAGALQFALPAAQTGTYLNETRTIDTVDFEDNWYNQFKAITAIGTDFLPVAEEIKLTADTFAEDEEGISLGIISIADLVSLGDEVRAYPGGAVAPSISYTPQDLEEGRAHKTVYIVNGVMYYANRWMTAARVGKTEAAYLINPNAMEYWVNAGHDFEVTPFTDHLKTSNQDADIAYIILESQFAVPNLMANGCTSQ